jgi:hypothetical protein
MNARSTILLLLSLTTALCAASAPTEPNDTATQLRFEMNDEIAPWVIETDVDGRSIAYRDPGPIRPKYKAKLVLPRDAWMLKTGEQAMGWALSSPLAQQLSPAQKEFLDQGFGARVNTSQVNVPRHYSVDFYAVSEEDVKTMARALMDKFAANARTSMAAEREELKKRQERFKQNQAALPEKEKQLEQARKHYDAAKSNTYPLSDDGEACRLAEELILQMDRQVKTLDIDQAGLRGKLEVIDEYLSTPDLNNDIIETLEAQRVDLLIELSGLEARREAIRQIREEQHRFCTLFDAWDKLGSSIRQMKKTLERDEGVIRGITGRLENPSGDLVPPKVYENKVIVYPIEPADSQN